MDDLYRTNSDWIKNRALDLGFCACGIAKVRNLEEEQNHLQHWLDGNLNGTMRYMANHFDKRLDPTRLVEGAKSIISVLINYFPTQLQSDPDAPIISKYAYGRDYHLTVKEKLNDLLILIQQEISPCRGRVFVDSAPVLEKLWASIAGLGWIGKNSLLISKEYGSYVFIGELIIDLELAYDTTFPNNLCGSCSRCMDACPTGAIVAPHIVDARKCISYNTIENKDEIVPDLRHQIGNHIFGCDICQDVCPWNKKVKANQSAEFKPIDGLLEMNLADWMNLDQSKYSKMFRHSAFERAGFSLIKRNIGYLNK